MDTPGEDMDRREHVVDSHKQVGNWIGLIGIGLVLIAGAFMLVNAFSQDGSTAPRKHEISVIKEVIENVPTLPAGTYSFLIVTEEEGREPFMKRQNVTLPYSYDQFAYPKGKTVTVVAPPNCKMDYFPQGDVSFTHVLFGGAFHEYKEFAPESTDPKKRDVANAVKMVSNTGKPVVVTLDLHR